MNVTKDQANVYKILTDIILKFILTIVFILAFCAVMYYLLKAEPQWAKTAPLATIELVLSGTVYKMVDHFYPQKK
ncbi:hypothetical protein [uncultured Chryseobacterium sp.]|uniref:hypothetical protein n=1 Tax=uncultured Chryseobacterium sp. TaxID=259322 RepID=UPI00258B406D|nr:hypothetical protein [uncultured Chryseobacterium sp.]